MACATRWPRTAKKCAQPKPDGEQVGALRNARRPRRHARWRCAISTRCCAAMRRSRCLRKRCSALRRCRRAWSAQGRPWVGINFVQPEDGFISMRDYTLQMKMVGYLHSVYPGVHISAARGRIGAGPGAAGGSALSHPPGGGAGPCGAHRPRRGRDVRGRRRAVCSRRWPPGT